MPTISQSQIDELRTSASTALSALNTAYATQALAETLPLIGTSLGGSVNEATQVVGDVRTALLNALSALSGAASYTAAELEIEVANALSSLGLSGVVVSASVGTDSVTLTLGASGEETAHLGLAGDLALPGLGLSL